MYRTEVSGAIPPTASLRLLVSWWRKCLVSCRLHNAVRMTSQRHHMHAGH